MTQSEQFLAGEQAAGRLAEGEVNSDAGSGLQDQRLIEAGFPCHQVGAETQRERGASSALPPLYYLHVWWARRPLTPSRAAIVASLLPADADPEEFIQRLGIVRYQAVLGETCWTLVSKPMRGRIQKDEQGLFVEVDEKVQEAIATERERRAECRERVEILRNYSIDLAQHPALALLSEDCRPLPDAIPLPGSRLEVIETPADPAGVKEKIEFAKRSDVSEALGGALRLDPEDSYGYSRAFSNSVDPVPQDQRKVILDPTAGGGSIPFEALRLGHKVIANELNPVASVILTATADYPSKFGISLLEDIKHWGKRLVSSVEEAMAPFTPFSPIPAGEMQDLKRAVASEPELIANYDREHDHMGLLYCRLVTCPHCGGDAPLLNSFWLSKEGDKCGVAVKPQADGAVEFEPYPVGGDNRGPNGEDPNASTVTRGVGQCVHCQQAIDGDEIKRQARGESEHGRWQDRLYCVVAIRLEPRRDKHGRIQRYASGARAGEVKTRKARYFRAPNSTDLNAIAAAERELKHRLVEFEMKGAIPTEEIGRISNYDRGHRMYGEFSWSDMFTSRQLLGHAVAASTLQQLKEEIFAQSDEERAAAIVTYLQFALDKCLDYNCRHTRWEYTRGVIKGAFSRHNFAVQWTFGEMVFAGPSSGLNWGLSQVTDAYKSIAELLEPVHRLSDDRSTITITSESATALSEVGDASVDSIVMDPPYYDNVQYSELSDFYYVWQKRTLGDLYPGWFNVSITAKDEEAVANPARDGSARAAKARYEELMEGIFGESRRVLRPNGIMTLMFTHKSQDAWETLTNALIQSNWDITAAMPVESESGHSTHQMNAAAAASSIFIACRPADRQGREATSWSFGGGVKSKLEAAVRDGLREFERLNLNPVDRMVASWGRALRVYSAHWPVIDGEEEVTPTRAMQEAARVVAEEEVGRLSGGLVTVSDLDAESRLAVIALGINGLGEFAFDDGLQVTRSLNLALQMRNGNYRVDNETVVYANEADGQLAAPLSKKGSRLRLLKPEERLEQRLDNPQTLWDTLCGLIVNYREGGVVAARNYLTANNQRESEALRGLLKVWAKECRDDALRREALLIDYEL